MFDNESLRKSIEEQLNYKSIIPDDHKGAFVAYANKDNYEFGIVTALALKTQNGWEVEGELQYHPHGNGLKTGITVMKTW